MNQSPLNSKLVVIVGPTASGKSDLGMHLAKHFNGEIICADSKTVYKGMDIGTAKPSKRDQTEVPHHLLDIVEPNEPFNAADFKRLANLAISDISARGKLPIIVGGSGLYINSVVYDYQFPMAAVPQLRQILERLSDDELRDQLRSKSPKVFAEIDTKNRRRLIRAIEQISTKSTVSKQTKLRPQTLMLGIRLNKLVMQKRIEKRASLMLDKGIIDETQRLSKQFGWENEAMSGIIYRAYKDVVNHYDEYQNDPTKLNEKIAEAEAKFVAGDKRLVKKQLTWFKRNNEIIWLDEPGSADQLVAEFIGESV